MKSNLRRSLAIFLCLVMFIGMFPVSAVAEDEAAESISDDGLTVSAELIIEEGAEADTEPEEELLPTDAETEEELAEVVEFDPAEENVPEEIISDDIAADGIYLIDSGEKLGEFARLVNSGDEDAANACVVLDSDIVLSGAWTPIGNDQYPFTGSFDGRGFKICGLTSFVGSAYSGLFGVTENAVLSKLALENVNIQVSGVESAAAIVGKMRGGTLSESYVTGYVNSSSGITGGLVGILDGGVIENCYNTAEVYGYDTAGGIAGAALNAAAISCCYGSGHTETAVWRKLVGYIAGEVLNASVVSSYSVGGADYNGLIIEEKFAGREEFYSGFDFSSVWTIVSSRPKLRNNPEELRSFANASVTNGVKHTALLIGQQSYGDDMTRPGAATISYFANTLRETTDNWDINGYYDVSASYIKTHIGSVFSDSSDNDINLFLFCGHGDNSEQYGGYLCCFDDTWIGPDELAYALSAKKGHFYVIIDSCGSGGCIAENSISSSNNADVFNREIVEAFAEIDSRYVANSGAMRTNRFSVLTACGKTESSYNFLPDTYPDGSIRDYTVGSFLFVAELDYAGGCPIGWDSVSETVWQEKTAMYADTNNDSNVTFYEAYSYCYDDIIKQIPNSHVQIYPSGCTDVLFSRAGSISVEDTGDCGEDLTWVLYSDGTLEISGTGAMCDYSSSARAPWDEYSVKSVKINSGVTTIGDYAFYWCSYLTDASIPSGVTSIGDSAFRCSGLVDITIPADVTSIGDDAFFLCSDLTAINVSASNKYYSSKDGVLFNKNGSTLIRYPGGKTGAYSIPSSVTGIGDSAFSSCFDLTGVTIPDSVTEICDYAFYGCDALTIVTLPYSVKTIGDYAFIDCKSLISVTVGNGVTTIGDNAFRSCKSLTDLTIGSRVATIGDYAFEYCMRLNNVTLPGSLKTIGDYAFDCCALTGVTIPGNVTTIGDYAFAGCALTNVTIPASVTAIGEGAFDCLFLTEINVSPQNSYYSSSDGVLFNKNKTVLIHYPDEKIGEEYTIPDSVTDIACIAFSGCEALTNITIPCSVAAIGDYAFSGCEGLSHVYYAGTEAEWSRISIGSNNEHLTGAILHFASIPVLASGTCGDNVTWTLYDDGTLTISGTGAMYNYNSYSSYTPWYSKNSSIKTVNIGSGVTTVGSYSFYDCRSLTSVTIGSSVTSIGGYAFFWCGLTSVTIPNSVTSIGDKAFVNTSLTKIDVSEQNKYYSSIDGVLYDKTGSTLIRYPGGKTGAYSIPGSVTSIGASAFENCHNVTSVTIPGSVTSIGNYAFLDCDKLTSIEIPGSVTSIGEEVFSAADNLMAINVSAENANYSSEDGVLFDKTKSELLQYPGGKTGAYSVPDSVTSIGRYAFYACRKLTSVTIPSSVTSIGGAAFYNCDSLSDVYYTGTEAQWGRITIGSYNDPLTGATLHFAPATLAGDMNGDGEVTTTDVVRLMKYVVAEGEGVELKANGDVDGNGSISTSDVVRLMKYVVAEGEGVQIF